MAEVKKREIWVDNVKVIACVLVVLGHFFQSMVKSEIIETSNVYEWFNQTIYYFHVPLFFICSGYLYQKFSKVNSFKEWRNNVLKKLLNLGIPYFTFAISTWVIKNVFSSAVNNKTGNFVDDIFLNPMPPYWFLYALFFLFIVIPTFSGLKKIRIALIFFIVLRFIFIFNSWLNKFLPMPFEYIMLYGIWFVIGMYINFVNSDKVFRNKKTPICCLVSGCLFVILSIFVYVKNISVEVISLILGLIACFSIILFVMFIYRNNKQGKVFGFLVKYTMPIFLMHTIFAATFRSVLFKLGIYDSIIHIVIGLFVSFAGPVLTAVVMKHIGWLEILLYPGKFIRIR